MRRTVSYGFDVTGPCVFRSAAASVHEARFRKLRSEWKPDEIANGNHRRSGRGGSTPGPGNPSHQEPNRQKDRQLPDSQYAG